MWNGGLIEERRGESWLLLAVADRVSLVLLGSAKGGIIVYNHGLKTRVEIQRVLVVS